MSRITHLKIKIKTLAAESSIIRLDEQKALEHGRKGKALDRDDYEPHYVAYKSMNDHRTGIVRSTARENLIAYGYLRGLTIDQIESPNSDPSQFPDPKKIADLARNFSDGDQTAKQALHAKIVSELTEWKKKLVANQPSYQTRRAQRRAEKQAKRAAAKQVA